MQWTTEQQWAIEADRHALVTASAGSGKTAVLVARYVRLVLSGVDPQAIVAITFTRKAAAEMYARIAAEIDRRIAAATAPQELAQLKTLRERLTGAPISTIHSFCAQLLRRFSIEAGVLPTFTELTEAEAQRLIREVALNVVEELLLERRFPEIWEFVRDYGHREVLALVLHVVQKVERWVFLREVLRRPLGERLEEARRLLWETFVSSAVRCADGLLQCLRQLQEPTDRVRADAAELELLCRRLRALSPEQPHWESAQRLWEDVRQRAFRQDGQLKKWLQSEDEGLSSTVALLDQLLEAWRNAEEEESMVRQMELLGRIVDAVLERLEQEKRARNVLDFNDLQLKTLQLLEQDAVVERLRREIRYLLVDEFQDTNPVQYALVRRLLALGEAEEAWVGPHVFLVGDPKQGIYGFRDADVRVFEQARREILRRNRWAVERGLLPQHDVDARTTGDIHLPVSFRLAPELVAFVNTVAGALFPQATEQVAYEPLVCGRPQARGSVRFLLTTASAQGNQPIRLPQEELIARALLQWVEGDEPLEVAEWDAAQGCERRRRVRYGDIAILTRYRLSVPRLTAALQRYGIPYLVHAGAGFFQAPEIQDLYFLLRFLSNERDDLALAVALRAPFFALSDGQLLQISLSQGETLWEKLCQSAQAPGAEAAVQRAYEVLSLLRLLAPRLTLSELLREIGERTLWMLRLRHSPRFAQIQANVQKLREFARTFSARGFRTLADFVQELGALIEAEMPETEAVAPAGTDAVSILTIHAAKGLEFPVVVLAFLEQSRRSSAPLLLDERFGLVATARRWDEEAGIWTLVSTPAYVLAQATEEARQAAEEQRVLYVGLTRARDHLVLAGTLGMSKQGTIAAPKGLLGLLVQALGLSPTELAAAQAVEMEAQVECSADGQRWSQSVRLRIPLLRQIEPPVVPAPPQRQWMAPIPLLEPVPVRWSNERLSATHYALFCHAPESFLRRAILGFPATPEELLGGALVPRDFEQELPEPLVLGELLHRLLASVTLWTTQEGELLEERLGELAHTLVLQSPYGSAVEMEGWLCERAAAVVRTPFLQRHWQYFRQALREYSLTLPLGENFLTGTLDVVVPMPEGWEIWDWKLGAVHGAADCERLGRWYEPQLQVYAYLLLHRFPQQQRVCARLLFVEAAGADVRDEQWMWSTVWERETVLEWREQFQAAAERLLILEQR
jgi:ATP-dependent helicase/nuclease subunit A